MKTITFTIILVLSAFISQAQDCNKDLDLVNSLFEKMSLESALSDPDAVMNEFNDLKGSLGNLAKMSLKKDAPKMIFANGKFKKGNIKSGKKRIYVTPLIPKDSLMITINNPNKCYGGSIQVCSHTKQGKTSNVKAITISEENVSDVFQIPVTGLKGQILSITIKNESSNQKFEYTINAR